MKKTILAFAAIWFISISVMGQTPKNKSTQMKSVKQSREVVQGFFSAFGKGDFDGIINSFHDSCTIVGIREGERKEASLYGTYKGKEGAKTFISNLGNTFDTKSFSVENIISNGNITFANGKFTHLVKATGKTFSSDWALMCIIENDKILQYHFYEDSEMFAEANH